MLFLPSFLAAGKRSGEMKGSSAQFLRQHKKELETIWDILIYNQLDKLQDLQNEEEGEALIEALIGIRKDAKYSDGKMDVSVGEGVGGIGLKNVRATNINKDIGKYECAADCYAYQEETEETRVFEITYTSEFVDDGKKHYVIVTWGSNSF